MKESSRQIKDLRLKSTFTEGLPADESLENRPRQVRDASFSYVSPKRFDKTSWIHKNEGLLSQMGISNHEGLLEVVSGQSDFPGFRPYAMRYGGHQFGNWAGQLGDGRAINIAELDGEDQKRWVLQLKGAGMTPYSRGADGLAVLRSSIREYLMSEAMHHLGVPTTRALSLISTGDEVLRDVMYNGNPAYEPGAIVCRTAQSFLRFGSFEILAAQKEIELLRQTTDYVLEQFYAHIQEPTAKQRYLAFFEEVCQRSVEMVVDWQRVGFVHGVMNTDNMSILGLTIDYGPYGWLENFDPAWTPNTTDAQQRRYRFGNQPSVVMWNLMQLANSLFPLIEDVPALEGVLERTNQLLGSKLSNMKRQKLGISRTDETTQTLIENLETLMYQSETDYTIFYRSLADFSIGRLAYGLDLVLQSSYKDIQSDQELLDRWKTWFFAYEDVLNQEGVHIAQRKEEMNSVNPKYVLRNYMAQLAIEKAEKGDYALVDELYELLKCPYDDQPNREKWFAMRPDWALNKVGCSMLSCSS